MAVLVGVLLWAHATDQPKVVRWVAKPLAAACFVLLGLWEGALEQTWTTVLFAGLVLAAVGDVLLIPDSKRAFLGGLVSFLLGHVAYAAAFVLRGSNVDWAVVAALVCAAIAYPVLRWLWPHVERNMRAPVLAYVAVITAMVALAFGTYGARGDAWIVAGSVGFYLSDLSVARDRFVRNELANKVWGMPLYFGSQLILASTVGT
jgi:uncharacterized membrane protein YhhN